MSAWDDYNKATVSPSTLWSAAKDNDIAELTRLLDAGARIDSHDARGYSPLMLAAYSGNAEAFELLLTRGADPNSLDGAGNSVLMGAAFKGHVQMVRRLLDLGADATRKNQSGLDAVGFASMFGQSEIAALISEHIQNLAPLTK